ncbi:peptide chain release factor 3 [Pseudarthrobacter oxydans]|uniref:peptide chain release factor 3 n=1 Tax=Pseudarthrobacter oxydans TaxID=1671 RepID=UPI00157420EF|nr:peptide chain release factor 3 [Pseudarthrobacter oxydans]NSX36508.1 peptide chain release factor 3 [Pseudarthrobacter oxydans]
MPRTANIPALHSPPVLEEAGRRRTFAVISHPDAGKSTLTEALALYASVIKDAGVTHGKSSRHGTVSDWMGLEQERGISISSAALQLNHRGAVLNVVDTPGHADFSEDTYRVLAAVDFAVMLIDAAKGFEPQTLKLLAVCRRRGLPIITVINKWDRPGLEALDLIDGVAGRTGMAPVPLTWPAGRAGAFTGLFDLRSGEAVRLEAVRGGALPSLETPVPGGSGAMEGQWREALEEAELVADSHGEFDREAFHAARQTPVLFTAAAKNFGVRQLLDVLAELGPAPSARATAEGGHQPVDAGFSGFVFKVQAGQDAAHRDHIAFLRVCSGIFERGMILTNARLGRPFATKYAHRVIGRSREVIDIAWPGDIVGLVNAASLRVGDSLYATEPVRFPEIPHFAPELFTVARAADPGRYKQFRRGITQLEHEGVVQVLRSDRRGEQAPVLAAVGALQFEVAQHRMAGEFHAPATFEALPYTLAMHVDAKGSSLPETFRGGEIMHRSDGEALALFADRYKLAHFREDNPGVELTDIGA